MNNIATAIAPEAVEAISRIVHEHMDDFALRKVEVGPGEDHYGDPAIFIDAYYDLSERPIDSKVVAAVSTKVRRALLSMNEERFPYTRHHFAEDQKVAGYR